MLIVSPVTRFERSMVRKWLAATTTKKPRYEIVPMVSSTCVGLSSDSARSPIAIAARSHAPSASPPRVPLVAARLRDRIRLHGQQRRQQDDDEKCAEHELCAPGLAEDGAREIHRRERGEEGGVPTTADLLQHVGGSLSVSNAVDLAWCPRKSAHAARKTIGLAIGKRRSRWRASKSSSKQATAAGRVLA